MATANEQASRVFRVDCSQPSSDFEELSDLGCLASVGIGDKPPEPIKNWPKCHFIEWRRTERKEQIVHADGCVMDVFMDKPVYRAPAVMVRS